MADNISRDKIFDEDKIELLPCPFCGRKAELMECNGGWIVSCYYNDHLNALDDNEPVCVVNCETILTLKNIAITIWNNRWIEN